MTSKVEICNAALGKLGQDIVIVALTEQTKAAKAFNRAYDRVRDYVLADFAWPFATKHVALALDAETVLGWEYRYAYPSDCLDAKAVVTEDGARIARTATLGGRCWDDTPLGVIDGRQDFEVLYGAQSTSIVTDLEDAYLIYVSRVEDPARYAPHFVEALACRLAIDVAPVLAVEVGLKLGRELEQKYLAAKANAAVHALNESSESVEPMTPSLAARQ